MQAQCSTRRLSGTYTGSMRVCPPVCGRWECCCTTCCAGSIPSARVQMPSAASHTFRSSCPDVRHTLWFTLETHATPAYHGLLLTVVHYLNRLSGSDETLLSQAAKRQTYSRWHSTASMVTVDRVDTYTNKNTNKYLYTYRHMEQTHIKAQKHPPTHTNTNNNAFIHKPIYFNEFYINTLFEVSKHLNKVLFITLWWCLSVFTHILHTLIWIMLHLPGNTILWHF